MKKSTIWVLTILMAMTIIGLLYIEIRYMNDMMKMRADQFAEGVQRSLNSVSYRLEQDETKFYLEDDVNEIQASAIYAQYSNGQPPHLSGMRYSFSTLSGVEGNLTIRGDIDQLSKIQDDNKNLLNRYNSMQMMSEELNDRYLYQKGLIDEVILKISTQASNRPVEERVDSVTAREYIAEELKNNGLDLPFEFAVVNRSGIPIYATTLFPKGEIEDESALFFSPLFPNDPATKRIFIKVFFPSKGSYIYKSLGFVIPALGFTLVLLVVFILTIILAFRQKRLNEMKTDFINNMTHEFKTPISTISLAAQMLNDDSVRKSPGMMRHISTIINDETKRLRFQVEKVLQLSMFDRKKATLRLQEVDANVVIDGIINTFKIKAERYGGHINAELNAENAIINVDEMHFTNVIYNLLDNAVKYRDQERPLNLIVSTANISGERLQITIEDNGIGIKKEDLKRIFEKFYRVPTGNQHDVKGFGLGLAYVHKMVSLLGGSIKAESDINSGTKFIIILPLTKN
ncbi:MAG: HAMP domain-containing histidine kinase [Muribaculaceae bacterium]|nr:HAMP domain-containing histidine kinase [Muribaculaceae bacterium]